MSDLLLWLVVIEGLGALAWPLAFFLFRRLPDRGITLVKPLALLLAAYLLWLTGLIHFLPNTPATIGVILLLGLLAFAWLYYRRWPELESFIVAQWRLILISEALFLAFFLAWCGLLSEYPGINHTEKPMDLALLNGVLQSRFFPPQDPWLSGHSISYYYFGHFIMALPMKLAGISSNVGYNLAMASLPALISVAAFGLAFNLVRLAKGSFRVAVVFGLTAPLLVSVAGNLEGGLEFLHLRNWFGAGFWEWVGVKDLTGNAAAGSGLFPDSNWWWWRATRVIDTLGENGQSLDYTITEFPFFSFLLGDLHGHVLSLPFTLLFLSFALNLFLSAEPPAFSWLRRYPWDAAGIVMSLGVLAFINAPDFPVYSGILAALLVAKRYSYQMSLPSAEDLPPMVRGRRALAQSFYHTALLWGPLLVVSVVLFLPFYLNFSSQVTGILPVFGPGTRPFLFLVVMGLPVLLGLGLLARQYYELPRQPAPAHVPAIVLLLTLAAMPLLLWLAAVMIWGNFFPESVPGLSGVIARVLTTTPLLLLAALAGYGILLRGDRQRDDALTFALLLLAAAAYLLAGAELFRLSDFFGNRMNTVFKVYYQVWLLLGIVGSFSLYYCLMRPRPRPRPRWAKVSRYAWLAGAAMLLSVALYYPAGAALERSGLFREGHTFRDNTLDGLAYVRDSRSGEYEAIVWLRDEAEPGWIVEAAGDDYSEDSRISAATGRPTVLGWKGHEHQWRGDTVLFERREQDIAQIYQTSDPDRLRFLMAEYNIRYIYLGHRERADYDVERLSDLDGVLRVAFQRGDVIIYERGDNFYPDE